METAGCSETFVTTQFHNPGDHNLKRSYDNYLTKLWQNALFKVHENYCRYTFAPNLEQKVSKFNQRECMLLKEITVPTM